MNLIAFALAALLAQAAPATDANGWPQIAQDGEGRYYLDPASLSREGAVVRFRIRAQVVRGGVGGTHGAVMGLAIDCASRRAGFQSVQLFDAAGNLTGERTIPPEAVDFRPITAGMSEDQMVAHVCAPAPAGARR